MEPDASLDNQGFERSMRVDLMTFTRTRRGVLEIVGTHPFHGAHREHRRRLTVAGSLAAGKSFTLSLWYSYDKNKILEHVIFKIK